MDVCGTPVEPLQTRLTILPSTSVLPPWLNTCHKTGRQTNNSIFKLYKIYTTVLEKESLWSRGWLLQQDNTSVRQHTQAQIKFVCLFVALKHTLCLTASPLLQIGQFVHKTHFQSCADIHKQTAAEMLQALSQNDFGRCWKSCMEHSIASNGKLSIM